MNKDKKLYHLLNQIKIDTSDYKETSFSDQEKDALFDSLKKRLNHSSTGQRKPSNWKKPVMLIAATLLLVFLGLQTPVGQRVQAAAISFLESFRYSLTDALGIEERTTDDTSISVDQVQMIGDAEIKVEDMLLFDDLLLINILIDLDDSLTDIYPTFFEQSTLKINGEKVNISGETGNGKIVNKEKNVFSTLNQIYLNKEDVPLKTMDIELSLDNLLLFDIKNTGSTNDSMKEEGVATFSIATTEEELIRNTNKYAINQTIEMEQLDFSINQLQTHPLLSLIEVTTQNWGEDYQLIELRGHDKQGNHLVFTPFNYTVTNHSYYGRYNLDETKSDITSEQLDDADEITLQFYSAGHPEGTDATYEAYGEPFTIEMNQ